MTLAFTHETLAQRVRFGAGLAAAHVREEAERLGADRPVLIAAEPELAIAGQVTAEVDLALTWSDVAQHVPVEKAREARRASAEVGGDALISVGGGSTTGLAKAIALESGLPIVAVPTTYAGSEATNVWGLTEDARKTTGVDPRVLPTAVVYDADLTLTLPVGLSVASGLNGIAHCVDSFWAPGKNPINAALATEGLRAIAEGLRLIIAEPQALPGREQAQYGAYLAAVAFASAGSGIHHKICHVLGGTYDLPHAETHATVLPYVAAFNAPAAPDAERRIAAALGADEAIPGLADLYRELGAPKALHDLGFERESIPEAVEIISAAVPESNPRATDTGALTALLTAAWAGASLTDVSGR